MALSQKDRQQLLFLLILLAVGAVGAFWFLWRQPRVQQLSAVQEEIDSLRAAVDSARQDLARGTVEDLRQRAEDYEASLRLMRQLVPLENEMPTLIDNIASRATLRGVHVEQFSPPTTEESGIFDVQQFQLTVVGHYDGIGEFLADVASLPRIMVPYELTLGPATLTAQTTYGDTTGALLEAQFQLRTFVKPPAAGGSGDGS
ncbi:MAG: type 4a pilus biogenesis protein PilO [Gemmatimonadales bacterium]|nr:type 4a pilus biogenesis protein PilO [Gemmatimonadales bacterium]NIN11461.1 type 4a pilus biogenesis protein PilO [Gemmatimonadales bacterium]NIN50070.1 type 4a pilus biogenesis protein PilO [Gemmatimonadales bacterium]NIP07534.1 type 4a pilus biogenesis protein PilO [Gemmatimonadales bacterium]NIR03176.1 type 4a pilus biogenesis protein PilO [Gemmatimonadales bacterium]